MGILHYVGRFGPSRTTQIRNSVNRICPYISEALKKREYDNCQLGSTEIVYTSEMILVALEPNDFPSIYASFDTTSFTPVQKNKFVSRCKVEYDLIKNEKQ